MNFLAFGILTSYAGLIVALFGFITASWKRWKSNLHHGLVVMSLVSFAHTWYYMFSFIKWSFDDYKSRHPAPSSATIERASDWLTNTKLFEQAWAVVSTGLYNWWWSEQLCLFTAGPWTAFLFFESKRLQIPHVWAYMFLGQVVAISVASNLFFIAIRLAMSEPSSSPTRRLGQPLCASPWVWIPIFVSLATIWRTPAVAGTSEFLPNLLVMHVLLFAPFIPPSIVPFEIPGRISSTWLYAILGSASLVIRARTLREIMSLPTDDSVIARLWETLHSHPAQSSIGWDVIWTTISFILYFTLFADGGGDRVSVGTLIVDGIGSLFVSISIVASTRLMAREAALAAA
ncbi:uncharacterized protein EI90DRAFT_2922474 [Cantharellus anzutake]|uniref:uncharacterized protein n=1 Tax=Cantharellus anzutake TaxID=1750568 RepID=UPI0019062501|nr:uncharacterized protein EI90DRAFT_2922474 [Cantharellus anzutake]KAF8330443.1 hypothetical protein EI90DRAFT_2922474 [Cantharellus anzutake]